MHALTFVEIRNDDPGALPREVRGDCAADPARPAGDYGHLPIESTHERATIRPRT